jgi:hypothetical protein
MKPSQKVDQRIQEIVCAAPGCSLDEIIQGCSVFSWNQVLGQIGQLTRGGALILKRESGVYSFWLPVESSAPPGTRRRRD